MLIWVTFSSIKMLFVFTLVSSTDNFTALEGNGKEQIATWETDCKRKRFLNTTCIAYLSSRWRAFK